MALGRCVWMNSHIHISKQGVTNDISWLYVDVITYPYPIFNAGSANLKRPLNNKEWWIIWILSCCFLFCLCEVCKQVHQCWSWKPAYCSLLLTINLYISLYICKDQIEFCYKIMFIPSKTPLYMFLTICLLYFFVIWCFHETWRTHRWLSARLQYLHCISTGDTAVLH